ncbi:MAG: helix-turn-helix domain containing protein, partial [Nitrososphaerota archaeon]|nr:helix-turn-helix domain containing protein [Nitrososphaerota archaeon]MDR2204044.1 helix-turn-helix domain containing protein [Nitrososphaerota archaeon]
MDHDVEKLKKWIINRKLEGQSVRSICVQVKISRKMFYYWWNRYQTSGWEGLKEK